MTNVQNPNQKSQSNAQQKQSEKSNSPQRNDQSPNKSSEFRQGSKSPSENE